MAAGVGLAGLTMITLALAIGIYIRFIGWWVHPEWTNNVLFWTYLPESLLGTALGVVGAVLVSRSLNR